LVENARLYSMAIALVVALLEAIVVHGIEFSFRTAEIK